MKNSILFLKSRFFLKQILGALLVLFLLVVISMQMLAWTTEHGNYIVVPDLSKKDINEVANILAAQSLRFQVIDSANFRSDFPKNAVISQKPLAGSEVKVNKKIYLQLNPSGYANISLLELVQVTKRNATSKLQAVGLTVEKVTYIDALGDFPKHADKIRLDNGLATLIKTDIFKGIMYYSVQRDNIKGPLLPLSIAQVKKLLALNKDGIKIKDIDKMEEPGKPKEVDLENIEHEFADVTGEIVLPELKRRNKGRNNRKKPNSKNKGPRRNDRKDGGPKSENKSGKPEAKRRENPNKEKSNNPPRAINTGGQKSDNKDNQGPKSESKGDGQKKSKNNNRKKFDRNKNKPNQNNSNDNKAE